MKSHHRLFLLAFLITAGLGGLALAIWLLMGGAAWLAPLPTLVSPPQERPRIGYTPIPIADVTLTPSLFYFTAMNSPTGDKNTPKYVPTQTNPPPWHWEAMPSVGLQVKIPNDWSMNGEIFEHECGTFGGALTTYTLTSPASDYLQIYVTCPPMVHVRLGPCYSPVILDESRRIFREEAVLILATYSEYSYDKNEMQCPQFGWPVGDKYVLGAYYNRNTFKPNYPVVDRIMLSVRKK
jgi:hypothetical protein